MRVLGTVLASTLILGFAAPVHAAAPAPGDVLAVDATGHRVLLLSVADGTAQLVTTIPLPGSPGDAALSRDGGFMVAISGVPAGIVRVDPISGAWAWLTQGGSITAPVALTLDTDGALLVLQSNGGVVRVDPVTGTQTALVPAGTVTQPGGIVVLPDGNLGLTDSGRVIRWRRSSGAVTTLAAGADLQGAGQLALTPDSHRLYLCCVGSILDAGVLIVMDATTGVRAPALTGFNIMSDVSVALDGALLVSEGGTTIWRVPQAGTRSALHQWCCPADPLDPSGTNSLRGLAVWDAPTPAIPATWGRIKTRYRR